MTLSEPDVTVCITAYRSGRMIEETLRSVRAQTYADFKVVISVDGPDAETEAVCRAESDGRFEMIVQPDRLGWVGNTNALLDRVRTPFFFILPHDDILGARYIEALRDALRADPRAINAYCDVETFGTERRVVTRPGLDGDLIPRVHAFLNPRSRSWIPWRGLTRGCVLAAGLRMRDNRYNGYGSHLDYVLALLCHGPFVRVAEPLYLHRDRDDGESVRTGFRRQAEEDRYASLLIHFLHCMETVSTAGIAAAASPRERRTLVQMLLLEFLTSHPTLEINRSAERSAADGFIASAGDLLAGVYGLPRLGAGEAETAGCPELDRMLARLRVIEAREALARRQNAAAEGLVTSALTLDPANGEAHWRNGVLLHRLGRTEAAIAAIRTAWDLLPANAQLPLLLARLLHRAGDRDGAVVSARAALAIRPGSAQAYRDLATYLAAAGIEAEALEAARVAAAAEPARFLADYEAMRSKAAAKAAAELAAPESQAGL